MVHLLVFFFSGKKNPRPRHFRWFDTGPLAPLDRIILTNRQEHDLWAFITWKIRSRRSGSPLISAGRRRHDGRAFELEIIHCRAADSSRDWRTRPRRRPYWTAAGHGVRLVDGPIEWCDGRRLQLKIVLLLRPAELNTGNRHAAPSLSLTKRVTGSVSRPAHYVGRGARPSVSARAGSKHRVLGSPVRRLYTRVHRQAGVVSYPERTYPRLGHMWI
jgi:hypothetical protein